MKKYLILASCFAFVMSCSNNANKSDAYGNFETDETMISAEASGKLIEFNVEEGKQLDSGAIAACVDTVQLHLKKLQLLAQKKSIATKYPNIASQISVYSEQLKTAQNEKNRVERLFKDKAATQKQLDDINSSVAVIERQISSIGTQNSSVASELGTIETQIAQIDDQIVKSKTINPFKSIVLAKYVEKYEIVAPGKTLYKIADLSSLNLKAYISGEQLAKVQIGQKVKVYIDDDKTKNKEYAGEIIWISSKAEFTPKLIQTKDERVNMVYAIKIKVINDGYLKIGMPGEAKFN